ncbi:MAG: RluA family pseudouridine synthase [Spirochaetaceae bacterium]|jgi:23S rRNA pseudouridine1911/1915/1917 synthase|nr:RluA family pseudouridine synthase [Spirochaetaceae bacterium]
MSFYQDAVRLDCENSLRLDRYIAEKLALMSRSQIKVRNLKAVVNKKQVKISFPVKAGDFLVLNWDEEPEQDLVAENIPLDIMYEDDNLIVIDKAQGMVSHPAAGNWSGTFANALLFRIQNRKGISNTRHGFPEKSARPFIVHRLDKDTSGVMIAAYNIETLNFLQDEFKGRHVRKTYLAITQGTPPTERGTISSYIIRDKKNRKCFTVSDERGKLSVTGYRVIKQFFYAGKPYAFVSLSPKTGRTHQLRVHLKHLGCPILGDPVYGKSDGNFPHASLMLHAYRLAIMLPGGSDKSIFTAPLPQRFRALKHLICGSA